MSVNWNTEEQYQEHPPPQNQLRTEITQQAAGKALKCNHTADEKKEEKRRNEVL